ncbi:MAG: PKD domain-containing protein [Patescibacteria group bacterium]
MRQVGNWYRLIAYTTLTVFMVVVYGSIIPFAFPVHAATVGEDTFTRSVSGGWGNNDTGQTYSYAGGTSIFSVSGGEGRIGFTFPGQNREAYLPAISEETVDLNTKFSLSGVPTGGGYTIDMVTRRIDGNNSYRARVDIESDGSVKIALLAITSGAPTIIAEQTVAGLTYTANMDLWMRARFVGVSPTTIDMKLWQDGQIEPDWMITGATDSTPTLQAAGAAGLFATSSSDDTAYSVYFDDLTITDGSFVNVEPTVEAGDPQTISLPNTSQMSATVTDDDFPGNPLTLLWELDSGPAAVSFSDNTIENPVVTFTQTGTYVLRLSADDDGTVPPSDATDTVTITVEANTAPTVEAGSNQTINLPDNDAALNATVTDNAPGTVTRQWSVTSAPPGATYSFSNDTAEDPTFTMTNNTPGTYTLQLEADDGEFQTTDTMTVTLVLPDNTAPTVDAGDDATVVLPDSSYAIGASISDDGLPVGSSVTILWELLSGPGTVSFDDTSIEDPTISFISQEAGEYTFQVTADDTDLQTADTIIITLQNNQAPSVDAGLPQAITLPNPVFLNATVTDDGKLNPYTLQWTKVSGPGTTTFTPASTIEDPQVSFGAAGTYVLQLEADDGEFQVSDTVEITVNADPNATPTPTPTPTPINSGSSTSVYRFWSPKFKSYFYTASLAEREDVRQRYPSIWQYQGEAFRVLIQPVPNSHAVYRFWSPIFNSHFYTSSTAERDRVISLYSSTFWRYEGIAWYVYLPSSSISSTSVVSRFWSDVNHTHLFTTNQSEINTANSSSLWRFEGQVWRVPN